MIMASHGSGASPWPISPSIFFTLIEDWQGNELRDEGKASRKQDLTVLRHRLHPGNAEAGLELRVHLS